MAGLKRTAALRYVQPLREGGSLPAVVDTDDGMFVVKFRGAGQGSRALVAELVVGLLAQRIGLPVPDLALVDVDPVFGRSEPDPEIQDLLRASHGVNVGLRYLDGALNFGSPALDLVTPELASRTVWLDAFTTNPDRTHRNPNVLLAGGRAWLIDHGAALYAHHDWARVDEARTRATFPLIRDHVLLASATDLERADQEIAGILNGDAFVEIVAGVPDELLAEQIGEHDGSVDEVRERYVRYLTSRFRDPRDFVAEAVRAKAEKAANSSVRKAVRR